MTKEVRNSIEAIRALSPRLNSATDKATEIMAQVEAVLNDECSIGIPAKVTGVTRDDHDDSLCYDRIEGKFRIGVHTTHWKPNPNNPDDADDAVIDHEELRTWTTCSRHQKLKTFAQLPDLLREIARNVQAHVDEADGALETAKTLKDALVKKT